MIDLSKDDIRLLTDDASFVRGMGYLAERRVFDALLADARLTGRAVGSMDIPYEMEIVLGPDGVESGRCTCPRGGFCKHLVALALMLVELPGEVVRIDRGDLARRLRDSDPGGLVDLIVDHAAVDAAFGREILRFLGGDASGQTDGGEHVPFAVLVERSRELARSAAPGWPENPYRAGHEFASGIRRLLMGASRESGGGPVRELAFYTGIYQGIEASMDQFDDSDGAVAGAAAECVDAMIGVAGLERVDPAARRAWLEIVVPLYLQDDYGLGEQLGEAIAEVASTAECDHAIDLVRGELRGTPDSREAGPGEDASGNYLTWSRKHRIRTGCELLADLLRRSGREEEADAVFLEAELHERTVLYRIATGKPADALEHACAHIRDVYEVRSVGRAFLDAGMAREARAFLEHVVPHLQSTGSRHADILELWARATDLTGEPDRALGLRFSAFVEQPSVRTYDAVMTTARQLAREAEIEEKMLAALPRDDGGLPALVELHVHRRDVDAAVEAFDRIERYRSEDLALKVATLAATRRPDVSRRLITEIVEDHIARKNRSHYARAAHVAIRLRDVMTPSELGDYLRDLRERYRRLRALQDELDIVFGR